MHVYFTDFTVQFTHLIFESFQLDNLFLFWRSPHIVISHWRFLRSRHVHHLGLFIFPHIQMAMFVPLSGYGIFFISETYSAFEQFTR